MEYQLYCMVKCGTNIVVAFQWAGFDAEIAQRGDKRIGTGCVTSDQPHPPKIHKD